jgi:hypothetical protein
MCFDVGFFCVILKDSVTGTQKGVWSDTKMFGFGFH